MCPHSQDITTVYQKERHEFGRPVNTFAPTDAFVLDEFLPEKAEFAHIERNPTILDIQAIPTMSETYVRRAPSDLHRPVATLNFACTRHWSLGCCR